MTMKLEGESVNSFAISQLAQVLKVSTDTLRRWEEEEKITPPSRGSQNERRYGEDCVRSILAHMARIMCGNPDYPNGLMAMYPRIASLNLNAESIPVYELTLTID